MTRKLMIACLFVVMAASASPIFAQTPLGTAITYQGQLKNNGSPANGNFNMAFRLFDAATVGNQVGSTITQPAVAVADGLFTASLDFGSNAYGGNKVWLEVTVNGTPLSPRQELTAAPYARYAAGPWSKSGTSLSYSSGNVGIGTTNPLAPLSLGSSVTNTKLALWDGGLGNTIGLGIGSAQFRLHLAQPGDRFSFLDEDVNGNELMTIRGTGNVGIGTTSPGKKLSIGDAATHDSEGMIRLASRSGGVIGTASRVWDIGVPETDDDVSGSGYSFVINDAQNGTEPEFTINYGSGNVGIGTTAPARKLSVGDENTPNSEGMIRLASRSGTGGEEAGYRVWDVGVPETDQDFVNGYSFVIDDVATVSTTEFAIKYGSGKVGIGTIDPSAQLSLSDTVANTKLALWDGGPGNLIGLGIGPAQFRLHLAQPSDRFSFLNDDVSASEVMTIQGTGNVGIGTVSPANKLSVAGNADFAGNVGIGTTAPAKKLSVGDISTPNSEGMIRLASLTGSGSGAGRVWDIGVPQDDVNVFGYSFVIDDTQTGTSPEFTIRYGSGNVGIGTTNPTAKLHVVGTTKTQVLEITGGADIAEPFNVNTQDAAGTASSRDAIEPGMVVCIDSERSGDMTLSTKAYDRTVAGIISGAGGVNPGMMLRQTSSIADGKHPVALSGRVYCWVDAEAGGAVKAGDMLTTSNTPGHAMKVKDHAEAQGAVLGKAMSSLSSGKGLVLVLVTLQ